MPHIHEKIDLTVAAYIVHERTVLLINHRQLKMWLPIGGHVELDEDPEEALFREIEEESGIEKEQLEVLGSKPSILSEGTKFLYPPTFLDIHKITNEHRHIGMIYLLRSATDKVNLEEREHTDIRWFSRKDLESTGFGISPAIKLYARQALDTFG
jgi:8-oxo-dGTP pyrophosphatase MutT (NUDIX family)